MFSSSWLLYSYKYRKKIINHASIFLVSSHVFEEFISPKKLSLIEIPQPSSGENQMLSNFLCICGWKNVQKQKKKPLRIWLLQFFFLHFIDWAEALAKNLKTWKKIRMIAKSIHIIRGIFFALFVTNYAYKDDDIVSHGTLRNTSSRDLSQIICAKKKLQQEISHGLNFWFFPKFPLECCVSIEENIGWKSQQNSSGKNLSTYINFHTLTGVFHQQHKQAATNVWSCYRLVNSIVKSKQIIACNVSNSANQCFFSCVAVCFPFVLLPHRTKNILLL